MSEEKVLVLTKCDENGIINTVGAVWGEGDYENLGCEKRYNTLYAIIECDKQDIKYEYYSLNPENKNHCDLTFNEWNIIFKGEKSTAIKIIKDRKPDAKVWFDYFCSGKCNEIYCAGNYSTLISGDYSILSAGLNSTFIYLYQNNIFTKFIDEGSANKPFKCINGEFIEYKKIDNEYVPLSIIDKKIIKIKKLFNSNTDIVIAMGKDLIEKNIFKIPYLNRIDIINDIKEGWEWCDISRLYYIVDEQDIIITINKDTYILPYCFNIFKDKSKNDNYFIYHNTIVSLQLSYFMQTILQKIKSILYNDKSFVNDNTWFEEIKNLISQSH